MTKPIPLRHSSYVLLVTSLVAAAAVTACATLGGTTSQPPAAMAAKKPNILVILADDLGYSDLGAFGGEIATPNIDALAASGRVLTNFHTSAVCSPTRARLMSGADHHLAGIGNMGEVVGLNIVQNNAPWGKNHRLDFDSVPPGYQGHLRSNALSMAELLRDGGYETMMVGKWHLGYQVARPDAEHKLWFRVKPDALPSARGFNRSFTLIDGAGSHFAPPTPPTPVDSAMYADEGRILPASQLPKNFYSTATFTDKLIGYIDANRGSGKPFFAYAAYTAPHWPLQAPDADIAAQRGRYDDGYEVIRTRRIARMKQMGLIPQAMQPAAGVPSPSEGGPGPKRWNELSADERAREARLMEVYAAMVSNLDAHIGRLVNHLKQIGEYDNTLIVFMSDNGAEAADVFMLPTPGTKVDNSPGNIGRVGSAVAYGLRWAEVSATPLRLVKGFTGAEGATAAPLIIRLPAQHKALPTTGARMQVTDVLPTLLDAAGVANPGQRYQGREVIPIEGRSFFSALRRPDAFAAVHSVDDVLADELMGASYVVKGRWKLSQQPSLNVARVKREDTPWQLFDLSVDRGETQDLAAKYPEVVADLLKARAGYAHRTGLVEHDFIYSGR